MASRLNGEKLTDEEVNELQRWLDRDKEHYRLYEMMQIFWDSGQAFRKQGGPDRHEAFRKIANRSFRLAEKKKTFLYRLTGVAAILLLLIGITLIWEVNGTKTNLSGRNENLDGMKPHTVRLELSDGKFVDLSHRTTSPVRIADVRQAAVVYDSNFLRYTADDKITSELPEYNTLVVPAGAEYRLLLSDGTRVYLNAASELRYPTRFTPENREVFLKGEAYFEVSQDTSRRFIVRTTGMDIMVYGTYELLDPEDEALYVYTRTLGDQKLLVMCNFTKEEQEYTVPETFAGADVLISNYPQSGAAAGARKLRAYEAVVLETK